jgi:hypothetical protein
MVGDCYFEDAAVVLAAVERQEGKVRQGNHGFQLLEPAGDGPGSVGAPPPAHPVQVAASAPDVIAAEAHDGHPGLLRWREPLWCIITARDSDRPDRLARENYEPEWFIIIEMEVLVPDHPNGTIRLVVVTTAGDIDDKFRLDQPLQAVFDKALREVGGERNPDQFTLEYHDVALADLSRTIGDYARELGWEDGTQLELVPKPVVV